MIRRSGVQAGGTDKGDVGIGGDEGDGKREGGGTPAAMGEDRTTLPPGGLPLPADYSFISLIPTPPVVPFVGPFGLNT
jgi:hypothetical protein